MNEFGHFHGGPPPAADSDEHRLQQVRALIARCEDLERAEAARLAEEARRKALEDAQRPTLTLEHLRAAKARLEAAIALRDHHLQLGQEIDLLEQKIASLQSDVATLRDTLDAVEGELAATMDRRQQLA